MTCSQIWLNPLVDDSEFTSVIYFFWRNFATWRHKKGACNRFKKLFLFGWGGEKWTSLSPHYEEMFFEITIFRH
jgi:hypothetical protein